MLRGSSIAHTVNKLYSQKKIGEDAKYLVMCGVGHMAYGFGVPEKIVKALYDDMYLIYSQQCEDEDEFEYMDDDLEFRRDFMRLVPEKMVSSYPGDLVFIFE